MIGRLVGKVVDRRATTIVLDVNGVGYEVDVPTGTLFGLPESNQTVTLFTHLAVREDAQQLFGFIDQANRDLFRQLIKVNGIGAKTALAMLSTLEADVLVACILHADADTLSKVPGIGKKTAERVILDMRDKLKTWGMASSGESDITIAAVGSSASDYTMETDAIAALVSLGYKAADASKAVKKVADPDHSSEVLIRLALKSMVAQ